MEILLLYTSTTGYRTCMWLLLACSSAVMPCRNGQSIRRTWLDFALFIVRARIQLTDYWGNSSCGGRGQNRRMKIIERWRRWGESAKTRRETTCFGNELVRDHSLVISVQSSEIETKGFRITIKKHSSTNQLGPVQLCIAFKWQDDHGADYL